MSELQTEAPELGITFDDDHVDSDETTQEIEATAESGAELATATEEKQSKSEDSDQDKVQRAINKQHAKYREEERKRIAAENSAKELKEKLEKLEAEKGEIVIPPMPDAYDEDFEQKAAAREEAIRQQAVRDAQQKVIVERQQAADEEAEKAEQERINSLVSDYDKHTVTLGLDVEEISKAGKVVVDYGISGEVAEYILSDADGPLITKYLAANPIELDDLRNMTPINAAMKINTSIREAASTMKPQASQTPDPVEILEGRGAGEKKNPLIANATFV